MFPIFTMRVLSARRYMLLAKLNCRSSLLKVLACTKPGGNPVYENWIWAVRLSSWRWLAGEWGGRIPLSLTTVLAAQKWSGHPDLSRLLLVKSQVHQPSMLCPVNWCTRLESNQRCFLRAGLQSAATQPTVASRTLKNWRERRVRIELT